MAQTEPVRKQVGSGSNRTENIEEPGREKELEKEKYQEQESCDELASLTDEVEPLREDEGPVGPSRLDPICSSEKFVGSERRMPSASGDAGKLPPPDLSPAAQRELAEQQSRHQKLHDQYEAAQGPKAIIPAQGPHHISAFINSDGSVNLIIRPDATNKTYKAYLGSRTKFSNSSAIGDTPSLKREFISNACDRAGYWGYVANPNKSSAVPLFPNHFVFVDNEPTVKDQLSVMLLFGDQLIVGKLNPPAPGKEHWYGRLTGEEIVL